MVIPLRKMPRGYF